MRNGSCITWRLLWQLPVIARRPTLLSNGFERAPVSLKNCPLACKFLPTVDNAIRVFRIDFGESRFTVTSLAPDQRTSRPAKKVSNDISLLAAIQQRTFDQFDWLCCWEYGWPWACSLATKWTATYFRTKDLFAQPRACRRSPHAGICSSRSPKRMCFFAQMIWQRISNPADSMAF